MYLADSVGSPPCALTACGRAAHARTSPSRHHRHHHEARQPMKRRHEVVRAVRCTSQRRSKCIDAPAMCAEPCARVFRRCCGGCEGRIVRCVARCERGVSGSLAPSQYTCMRGDDCKLVVASGGGFRVVRCGDVAHSAPPPVHSPPEVAQPTHARVRAVTIAITTRHVSR